MSEHTVKKISCQGCGANLSVEEGIRFLNCGYCHAQLELVRSDDTLFTRVLSGLEEVQSQVAQSNAHLELISVQNELAALDREWELQRESFMVTGKNGHQHIPTSGIASIVVGCIAVVLGIGWTVVATSTGAPSFFPLFGLVFVGIAIFGMVTSAQKAEAHSNALLDYEHRRTEILGRIDQLRSER